MATFRTIVRTSYRKDDGTYRVYIRVTHGRVSRYIPTPFYVTDNQITRGGKLKDQIIIDKCNDRIKELRDRANNIGFVSDDIGIDGLIDLLKNDADEIDFFDFFRKHNEEIRKSGRVGTASVYNQALVSLKKYNQNKPLYFSKITPEYMLGYFKSISHLKPNTQVMYIGNISAVIKKAQKQYNNNTAGVIIVKYGLFDLIELPQKEKNKDNVFKTIEEMQRIIDVPYPTEYKGRYKYEFAKDMFILSFVCFGTNMADWEIIEKSQYKNGILYYRRKKTGRRSKDSVDIQIKVPEVGRIIIDKYSQDKKYLIAMKNRKRHNDVDRFIHYFYQEAGFEPKTSLTELGVSRGTYSFYANRHTMATIARNQCKVEYMTVIDMLNHSTPSQFATTDTYLFQDYTHIWEANDKLLSQFDWSFYINQKKPCLSSRTNNGLKNV